MNSMLQMTKILKKEKTRSIQITPGYSCNNDCIFCVTRGQDGAKMMGDMTTQQIKDIIRRKSVDVNTNVGFDGGEPTVRHDIIEILKFIKERKARIKMLTNGIRCCDPDFASTLTDYVDHLYVTVYAHTPELYGYLTRRKQNFDKMVTGVKNLFKLSQKKNFSIDLKILVCKPTAPKLPEIVKFISEEFPRPRRLCIHGLTIAGNSEKNKDEVGIRLKEAAPSIKEAINLGLEMGQNVTLRYIPPCIFDDPFYYDFCEMDSTERSINMVKMSREYMKKPQESYGPQCGECRFHGRCVGLWPGYANEYGYDELTPIKTFQSEIFSSHNGSCCSSLCTG